MRCRFCDDATRHKGGKESERQAAAGRSRERTTMGNDADGGKENRENGARGRAERIFQRGNFVITREERGSVGRPAGRNEIVSRFSSWAARGGITLPR